MGDTIREILDWFYFSIAISSEFDFETYRKVRKIQKVIESHSWWKTKCYEYFGISLITTKRLSHSELLYNTCNQLAVGFTHIESSIRHLNRRTENIMFCIKSLELNKHVPSQLSKELSNLGHLLYGTTTIFRGRVSI